MAAEPPRREPTPPDKSELVQQQAAIRDRQRERFDIVHDLLHIARRSLFRADLRGESRPHWIPDALTTLHETIHEVMREFEDAVLIHERMAELEGRDPREVTRALYPTRSVGGPGGR